MNTVEVNKLGTEIIQWRQTNLVDWYSKNIETMERAAEIGSYILDMGGRIQIALGQLFNHVEKHKGGRGIKGGCSELGRRLGIPRATYWTWMRATSTAKLAERSAGLGTAKVALIEHAPKSDVVWDWHDSQEKTPTYREIVREIKHVVRENKRAAIPIMESREEIKCDSIENMVEYINPDSVDLILTDPPYPKEYLPLWDVLFEKSLICLKEGGFLVAYSPHIYLPEIFAKVPDGLNYVWVIAQIHREGGPFARYHPHNVEVRWKPILVFVKGKFPSDIDYYNDILRGTGREKGLHKWQQALGESEELIERFTYKGGFVVDPFLGSGTFMIAAKKTNRSFFGLDIDEVAVNTTLQRLEEVERQMEDK